MNTTDYIEQTLESLVRVHGLARVQRDLERLLPRARFDDWQRLSNIAANVSNRLQREAQR